MSLIRRLSGFLWLCMALLMAQTAQAWCEQNEHVLKPHGHVAISKLRFGHINLTDEALQPYDVLDTLTVPATDAPLSETGPDTVLWSCDAADRDKIRFLVATHADWPFGGMYALGQGKGLDGVYYTAFRNIGLLLRMGNVTLTNHWQPVPVKSVLEYSDEDPLTGEKSEMIAIRLRDIPVMEASLYKISQVISGRDDIVGCHYEAPGGHALRIDYICDDYNGYLQLAGPGLHDDEEGTLATNSHAYTFNNGLAWGMYKAISLSHVPTCAVTSPDRDVSFGTITVQQLQAGGAAAHFSVNVECNGGPGVSGTTNNKTAIGLQASQGAFAAAKARGLVNPQDKSVEYLLSDQYGTPGVAAGVGIRLYQGGEPRRFVGQPGMVGKGHPRGENAGWYPVLQGATQTCNVPGKRCHQLDFTAKLEPLPGKDITPGKVRATAHVLVKVQ